MKFWPADSFRIKTPLSLEEVTDTLEANTEPRKWLGALREHKAFHGTVTKDGFKIQRYILYVNGYQPTVYGRFISGESGVTVEVNMGLNQLLVLGLPVLWWLALFFELFRVSAPIYISIPVPLGFAAFQWASSSFGFWIEASKQKRMLIKILSERAKRPTRSRSRRP